MNKYAIITINQLDEFYPYYVGEKKEQRFSIDGTKVVIKFMIENQNPIFDDIIVYTHNEILKILSNKEWTSLNI